MGASFEKTGLVVADWGCYDDWVGGIRRNGSKDLSQVSRCAVFPRGPNGAVSGPMKLKSNSMGVLRSSHGVFPGG